MNIINLHERLISLFKKYPKLFDYYNINIVVNKIINQHLNKEKVSIEEMMFDLFHNVSIVADNLSSQLHMQRLDEKMSEQDNKIIFRENITWDEIFNSKPEEIFYSASTMWWTHDENDLNDRRDSRGGVVFVQTDVDKFFGDAKSNESDYGKNGMNTLLAAHHKNSFDETMKPWCAVSWKYYDEAIDSALIKKQ